MKFLELNKKRHATKHFNGKPVDPRDVRTAIEIATLAPSAHNSQPWKFVVVRERNEALAGITFGSNQEQIKEALLNAVNKSTPQKEECDRKIVIEQDFLTQKEGAIRKIETIRTRVIENGVLVLDKETIPEDYKYSELKDAIDYIVKGQIVKRKFNGEDFPSLHS